MKKIVKSVRVEKEKIEMINRMFGSLSELIDHAYYKWCIESELDDMSDNQKLDMIIDMLKKKKPR